MMKSVLVLSLVFASACAVLATSYEDIENVIKDIPEEERVEFLKYHLQVGYNLAQRVRRYINKADIPPEFSISLYNYAREHYAIEDGNVLDVLRKILCFEDGTCINIGDIGVHP